MSGSQDKRTCKIIRLWAPDKIGVFSVTLGRSASYYRFREFRCEIGGRAWEVWKLGAIEAFYVRTSLDPAECGCDCIGFEARRRCRHLSVMLKMLKEGLLKHKNGRA